MPFAAGLVLMVASGPLSAALAIPQIPPGDPPSLPSSQPTGAPTSELLYAQGCARLEAGEPVAAIRLLKRALSQRPDSRDYTLALARAYAAAGRVADGLQLTKRLAARHPQEQELQVALAEFYALDKNWMMVKQVLTPLEGGLDAEGLVLLARAWTETGQAAHASAILQRGLARHPDSERLWLASIDQALELQQCALALQRIEQARRHVPPSPRLHFRAAQAYYHSGQALGATRVIRVPDGRAGQFADDWLLVEKRAEPDRFLCCPKASALYALRRALDAGLDKPEAHCLHARIWQQAGRPEVGLAILQSREALWLENASTETLATFADLALAADALDDYLRYVRRRAAREPQRRREILYEAFVAASECYNQRGDEVMSRELLRRALTLRPENVELMLTLADAVWDAGDREEARIWYRRVLEREPAHPEHRRLLGRLED